VYNHLPHAFLVIVDLFDIHENLAQMNRRYRHDRCRDLLFQAPRIQIAWPRKLFRTVFYSDACSEILLAAEHRQHQQTTHQGQVD